VGLGIAPAWFGPALQKGMQEALAPIERRLSQVEKRLDEVEKKAGRFQKEIGKRFDSLEKRHDNLEKSLNGVHRLACQVCPSSPSLGGHITLTLVILADVQSGMWERHWAAFEGCPIHRWIFTHG
jgi:hypothetical protein